MRCGWPSLSASIGLLLVGAMSSAGEPKAGTWLLLEGVSHENLTVFPVVLNEWADTGAFVTLDEALTSGGAIVTEQGSPVLRRSRDGRPLESVDDARVDRLMLVNRGPKSLILLAGEVLSGGKQDRVVAKDRVVPAGGPPLPLDVFCVERGRWALTTSGFSTSKLMLHPSVREKAAVEKRQAEVWAAVREGTTSSGVAGGFVVGVVGGTPAESPRLSREALERTLAEDGLSESYAKLYQAARLSAPIETFIEELGRQFERATAQVRGVVGVVVTYGSEVVWCDRFASPRLFRLYWPKLLRSYTVEALMRSQANEHASLDQAREFLRGLRGGRETLETEPGVYRWKQLADDQYAEIELQALSPTTVELHWMKIRRTPPPAVRVGGAIKEPKKLHHVNPVYPDVAKQAGIKGVIILECLISPEGKVTDVKVLHGIPILDDAAVAAVKQWVYTRTLIYGVPVPVIMTVKVSFRLL